MNATTSSLALEELKAERKTPLLRKRVALRSALDFVQEANDESAMEAFPIEDAANTPSVVCIKGKVTVSF